MRLRLAAAAALVASVAGAPAHAASPDLVISQVYGGGGSTNAASFCQDYVEVFNLGRATISLEGKSIQYGAANGNFGATEVQVEALSGSLEPGEHVLVKMGTVGTGPCEAVPADLDAGTDGPILATSSGKVALAATTVGLACGSSGTPCSESSPIVDRIAYGTATGGEGSPTGALSATTAALREGCLDTDSNAGDFAVGSAAPRNRATPKRLCGPGPTVVCGPDLVVPEGQGATREVTASDPDERVTAIGATITPANLGIAWSYGESEVEEPPSPATALLEVSAFAAPGTHRVEFVTQGTSRTASCTFDVTIVPATRPGTFTFGAASAAATEGDAAQLTVLRTGGTDGAASVTVSTAGGTAGAGDFAAGPVTVAFADGQASRTVTLPTTEDGLDEPDETFTAELTAASPGTLGSARTASITISDDDPAPDPPRTDPPPARTDPPAGSGTSTPPPAVPPGAAPPQLRGSVSGSRVAARSVRTVVRNPNAVAVRVRVEVRLAGKRLGRSTLTTIPAGRSRTLVVRLARAVRRGATVEVRTTLQQGGRTLTLTRAARRR